MIQDNQGVTPTGSRHSAEPEPKVSALRASPANAADFSENELCEIFEYLDVLRESGVTNMYGASAYVETAFEMERRPAVSALALWMKTFDRETGANVRAAKALGQ